MRTAKLVYSGSANTLTRVAGLLWRKSIDLDRVRCIVAASDDSITHEGIHILFEGDDGSELVVSEFDRDFQVAAASLEMHFPGFGKWPDLNKGKAFEFRQLVLWERPARTASNPLSNTSPDSR